MSGSKPYAQCSYEKVITGEAHVQAFLQDELLIYYVLGISERPRNCEEPNDMELWFITHTKDGHWKDQDSRDVYVSSH